MLVTHRAESPLEKDGFLPPYAIPVALDSQPASEVGGFLHGAQLPTQPDGLRAVREGGHDLRGAEGGAGGGQDEAPGADVGQSPRSEQELHRPRAPGEECREVGEAGRQPVGQAHLLADGADVWRGGCYQWEEVYHYGQVF